jgi:hypothetical protein
VPLLIIHLKSLLNIHEDKCVGALFIIVNSVIDYNVKNLEQKRETLTEKMKRFPNESKK